MNFWISVLKEFDIQEISKHLLVEGELSAECYNCHAFGLKKDVLKCSHCGTDFKYLGLRKKTDVRYFKELKDKVTFIDFEDFHKEYKREKAKKLLDG